MSPPRPGFEPRSLRWKPNFGNRSKVSQINLLCQFLLHFCNMYIPCERAHTLTRVLSLALLLSLPRDLTISCLHLCMRSLTLHLDLSILLTTFRSRTMIPPPPHLSHQWHSHLLFFIWLSAFLGFTDIHKLSTSQFYCVKWYHLLLFFMVQLVRWSHSLLLKP